VAWADDLIDRDQLPAPPREWTVRENRWLAARYGIDARLIVEAHGTSKPERRPVRELVAELIAELATTADMLGTQQELAAVERILVHGSGSMRQRRLVKAGATLADVVHHLADELYDDCFDQA
jgi:carboxylate-amine ligase